MRTREAAVLACRLFGLFLIYQVLVSVPGIVGIVLRPSEDQIKWPLLLTRGIALPLVIIFGLRLWFKAGRIATRLVSAVKGHPTEEETTLADLQAIALSVLGMFVLTGTAFQVSEVSLALVYSSRHELYELAMHMFGRSPTIARFASLLVRLALGVGLLFCSRKLVGIMRTVPQAGPPSAE